jgi:purine-binding chemotaxis protein CheW
MDERARVLSQVSAPTRAPDASIGVIEFGLGRERYAIEVAFVREVVRLVDYTLVPGVPEYIVGVTNLRGIVLPIVDLRRFFNIAIKGLSDQSRVIVLGAGQIEFGVLADEAYGQLELGADDILAPPGELPGIGRPYLRGVTRDAVVILDGAALIADEKFFIRESR